MVSNKSDKIVDMVYCIYYMVWSKEERAEKTKQVESVFMCSTCCVFMYKLKVKDCLLSCFWSSLSTGLLHSLQESLRVHRQRGDGAQQGG